MSGWKRILFWMGVAGALALGLWLRVPMLSARPFHADEGVQGYKFVQLWDTGRYKYDPNEFHGPTLPYASLLLFSLTGPKDSRQFTDAELRVVPLLFGVGLFLTLLLWRPVLGRSGIVITSFFLAASAPFVFYNTYYIHETLLACFVSLFLASVLNYVKKPGWGWALLGGAAFGLMHATKETFVLNVIAAIGAGAVVFLLHRRQFKASFPSGRGIRVGHWVAGIVVAVGVSVVFFSSFFTNWQGPIDSIRTYAPWLHRAGGASPHVHPWTFYWHRLLWWHLEKGPVFTEIGVYGLALIGIGLTVLGRGIPRERLPYVRFLAVYTILLAGIYSFIAYKTPWCVLTFHFGFLLLAGIAIGSFVEQRRPWVRAIGIILCAGVLAQLTVQARGMRQKVPASPQNPWVYAHTDPDLMRLVQVVKGVAKVHPDLEKMVVKVIVPGGDYWPLPWYFRTLPHVGWYGEVPEDPFADLVILGARVPLNLDDMSDGDWIMAGFYKLRPGAWLTLYANFELWKRYVESLPPPSER